MKILIILSIAEIFLLVTLLTLFRKLSKRGRKESSKVEEDLRKIKEQITE